MATFQSEYEDTTNTIDSIVSSQLSYVLNFINIPGGLTKVVSSSSGFAWGYSGIYVYSCQLPCSGNWLKSDLSSYSIGSISDITTDSTNVYILYTSVAGNTDILTTSSNRQGVWSIISVPFKATNIFSTHTYLWAQDSSNNKQMCPKPCTTSNWIPSSENTISITSSTDTHLYGKDPLGEPMQTDETMRSGWSPISGFGETKVSSVIGSDNYTYAIDDKQNLLKYDGKSVSPVSTSGFTPQTLTTGNDQLWLTSVTPSSLGNIFTRVEKPDYSTLTSAISPLDKKRDDIVNAVESKFNHQTDVMTINKQTEDIVKFFKNMFKIDGETGKKSKDQIGHITEEIKSTQEKLDQINSVEPIMQTAIILLLLISGVYVVFSGLLGWITHVIALILLAGGVFFIVKFK